MTKQTRKYEHIPMDSGLQGLPEPVQKALHFAVQRADETCDLDTSQTALYWELVWSVNAHRTELKRT